MRDVFESSNRLYIVLELLGGGELFDRIVARGHYSERVRGPGAGGHISAARRLLEPAARVRSV